MFFLATGDDSPLALVVCGGIPLLVLGLVIYLAWKKNREDEEKASRERAAYLRMSTEEKGAYLERKMDAERRAKWGWVSPAMVCPHCQTKGKVRTTPVTKKKGISGAKATGAVLTGGLSVLATGLSRKENLTQAHCDNCNSTWVF